MPRAYKGFVLEREELNLSYKLTLYSRRVEPDTVMSVITAPPDRLSLDKGTLEGEGREQYLRTLGQCLYHSVWESN